MFAFLKEKLQRIYNTVTSKISALFSKIEIDAAALQELERILIEADAGVKVTRFLLNKIKESAQQGTPLGGHQLKILLKKELSDILASAPQKHTESQVYVLVGINGSGKTTSAGKVAYRFKLQGKKVLIAAADTFRAAAVEQLETWSKRAGVDIITGKEGQEPASVIFAACQEFKKGGYDILIADTAGRLQTKTHLMRELEKIRRIISQQLPDKNISTLLTIDAMLGQNSLIQAQIFNESTPLDGIVLTKMDGTGKGGIIFAIVNELKVPVTYISFGEHIDALAPFDAQRYVDELLG